MKTEMLERLAFADRALDAVVEAMQLLHVDLERRHTLFAFALHASIVQLCGGCVAMARTNYTIGISVLLRSMFEALVDLDNLVSDRHYAERMNAADHREMIKLLKEAPSNPLLVGLAAKHPVGELLATLEAQLADMENRNLGPLPVFARCKTAGRQHEYKTVYAMLCLDAHNNVTALMERHVIPVEGGSVELAPFGDGEPVVLARRLSFAMHWMLQSAEFVHGAFKTGYSVADFQQQHDVMRKALDPSPTHTNPTV